MKKTNAARILDQKKIKYDLIEYEVDENDLSATTVAAKLNQNVEQVFKTLVVRGDKTGIFVCVIPGNAELNLKKAAKISGNKNELLQEHTVHKGLFFLNLFFLYISAGQNP